MQRCEAQYLQTIYGIYPASCGDKDAVILPPWSRLMYQPKRSARDNIVEADITVDELLCDYKWGYEESVDLCPITGTTGSECGYPTPWQAGCEFLAAM